MTFDLCGHDDNVDCFFDDKNKITASGNFTTKKNFFFLGKKSQMFKKNG